MRASECESGGAGVESRQCERWRPQSRVSEDGGEGGGKWKRASPSRMHTELQWLRNEWCGRCEGVAWVHAATLLREREQIASRAAVPSAGCDGRPRQKRNSIRSSAPVPCQVLTGKFFLLFPRNSFSLICCATRLSPGLRRGVREIFINQQEITTLSWGVWLRRR